ncbi:EVE domain-containing protein [Azospirillum rugosum]|uniref:RNA-binding protein with PUA-like domain n=1 Tax=Azospirillum rugosum TaxID=416170 RepID=A0ABS4SK76_9PROT|nr:EVE domain-containing protein [Azospirillum rugosum]MBP2292357.1 putative RNA-binding protein with PUA-like domain [Azospirillum rugosum]MDQ0526116.1 putative RNA-binding protein with PUA-like domain [Azospirillum rugosum]
MARWLLKSEPFKYSWDRMVADGTTHWDGVRNHQASNNLKAMKVGDRAFFYHSNEGLEVVGVVEIAREYYPDPSDEAGRFGMVDVRALMPVKTPVTLKTMKTDPLLQNMALVRQSRLSVCPVSDDEWAHVCALAGIEA